MLALVLNLVAGCGVLRAQGQTIIEGHVTMPPPKPATAALSRYQQKSGTVELPEPAVAVVFLAGSFPASAQPMAELGQKGYQFVHGLLPIRKGTAVAFPNLDDDYHHVFSYSKTKEFDIGRYRKTERPPPVVFDKEGVVKIGCEIHDHMRAVILVLDTPHFTRSDATGKYRLVLESVPDGQYVLKAWLNEKTVREQKVEVKTGTTSTVNFPVP
jgi:plastocyanin